MSNKLTYEIIKLKTEETGFELNMSEKEFNNEYKDYKSVLSYKCSCGNTFNKRYDSFMKSSSCPKCHEGNKRFGLKYSYDYVREFIEKEGYELISKEYKGITEKLITKCDKGHIYNVTFNDFKNGGRRCPECSVIRISNMQRKTTKQFRKEVYNLVGNEYEIIGEYIGALSYITIKHNECGHVYNVTPSAFLSGNRCPQCAESKGEQAIRQYLDKNKLIFQQEHSFDDLLGIGGGVLRFDFAIFDNNNLLNLLIEYDGEFHFKKQYNSDGYDVIKKHDKIKDTYCLKNSIPLIRIPYWDFNNIEKILDEALSGNDSAYFIA